MTKLSLNKIVQLTVNDIFSVFRNVAEARKMPYVQATNYTYIQGNLPVTLLAHADTVHFTLPKPDKIFYDPKNRAMWSPDGIGGDDRCGIFALLSILRSGFSPSIIILDKEERGCIGARDFARDFPKKPKGMRFLIEIDRHGVDDAVFYNCGNEKFHTYIQSFGFTKQIGSCSDISEVMPAWNIAGVNLSSGYHREHTKEEYIMVDQLWATIAKVKMILSQNFDIIPEFDYQSNYKPYVYDVTQYGMYGHDWYNNGYYDDKHVWHYSKKPKDKNYIEGQFDKEVDPDTKSKDLAVVQPQISPFDDVEAYPVFVKALELTDVIKVYKKGGGLPETYANINGEYFMDVVGLLIFKSNKSNFGYYVDEAVYWPMRPVKNDKIPMRLIKYIDIESEPFSILIKDPVDNLYS